MQALVTCWRGFVRPTECLSRRNELVTVYTKESCPQCDMTTMLLDRKGVPFKAISIMDDESALETIKELGYLAAPVVVVGEDHWSGFRPDLIGKLVS